MGKIWLGTDKGLNRLDGFWYEAGKSDGGPQGADVFEVFEDRAGFIWVATNAGVYQGVWDGSRSQVDWLQYYTQGTGLIGIGGARCDDDSTSKMVKSGSGRHLGLTGLMVESGTLWRAKKLDNLIRGVQVIYEDKVGNLWFGLSQSKSPSKRQPYQSFQRR